MSKSKYQIKSKFQIDKMLSLFAIILAAVFLRLVPHPPNFAPIGALALFSGAYLSSRKALIIPLSAMLFSDYFIGFHSTMIFVYGSFILITLIGKYLKTNQKIKILTSASLLSSILFFIITNFGSWLTMPIYPKTTSGLINAYYMGIPFFRNTLLGDLVYTLSFFWGYQIITSFIKHIELNIKHNLYIMNRKS